MDCVYLFLLTPKTLGGEDHKWVMGWNFLSAKDEHIPKEPRH